MAFKSRLKCLFLKPIFCILFATFLHFARNTTVINYIVENKNYIGSHDALCSKLKLNIRGKGLQTLLKKNIDLLKDSNIYYEVLPRTSKARQMKMTYLGDEAL